MLEMALKLEKDFEGNKKMIYSLIGEKRKDRYVQTFMRHNGELTKDPIMIQNMWREIFKNF